MSAPYEFIIRVEGRKADEINHPDDIVTWPVTHPLDTGDWRWFCHWIEISFARGRLANGTPLPMTGREDTPEESVNLVAYREWLIDHCPGAKFVANHMTIGKYHWIKIVFDTLPEATEHRITWEGPGPVSD